MKIKLFDVIFLIIIIFGTLVLSYFIYKGKEGEPQIHINATSGEWYYNLNSNRELYIDGPLGKTKIIIQNNSVYVQSSPCPEKICIKSGTIHNSGEWIACLPNGILITIEGDEKKQIDAISY